MASLKKYCLRIIFFLKLQIEIKKTENSFVNNNDSEKFKKNQFEQVKLKIILKKQ